MAIIIDSLDLYVLIDKYRKITTLIDKVQYILIDSGISVSRLQCFSLLADMSNLNKFLGFVVSISRSNAKLNEFHCH